MLEAILNALKMIFFMGWEIFWALSLGFLLSGIIQATVSKGKFSQLLPDASIKSLGISCGLGAASSSCSYAAVALTRSIILKGANFIAAMGFQIASTNLVIELGIVMFVLLGWQFVVADYIGGILIIYIVAVLFKRFVPKRLIQEAETQAEKGFSGKMEGHAKMDMAVTEGTLFQRIFSRKGFTAISHYYIMDWLAIWKDIAIGIVIAGILAAWVPTDFWQGLFLESHHVISAFWGPIIGPLIAIISFICSVGNVPLAVVLWNGGISFGGVIAFIFSDLLILPILDIYKKYYGFKMMVAILVTFYVAIILVSLLIEFSFNILDIIPKERNLHTIQRSLSFNYTTILNVIFIAATSILSYRFLKTNGLKMLKHM